ncbi:flagellar protein FliT [Clostridium oceanicum]|uniref:Flagellar protein FliT n=1 Tax=Clostridium oceanicum TaxID=1543 RepID=A0ABP3V3V6_9CLOT
MESLKKHLKEFKEITLKLIEALNKEDYDSLDRLISDRQSVIENIDKIQYTKKDFKKLIEEFDILKCNKKFSYLMQSKKDEYKKEMQKYALKKNASRVYNKDVYGGSNIFSKKI